MKLKAIFILTISFLLTIGLFAQSPQKPVTKGTATESSDRIEFQMTSVRNTGLRFPRLTFYPDAQIMREVNRVIDEVTSEFGCDDVPPGSRAEFEVTSRVEYATRDILSIYAVESFYCGGNQSRDNISLTFDLKTGRLVEFEQLFKDYEAEKTDILKIMFASQIARAEKLAASGKIKEGSCDGDPEIYSLENLENSSFAFNFSKEGLRVQPVGWEQAIAACAERVTVPYEKLKSFAAPDGLLARVLR